MSNLANISKAGFSVQGIRPAYHIQPSEQMIRVTVEFLDEDGSSRSYSRFTVVDHAVMGYRTGKHQCKPLRGWTLKKCAEHVKGLGRRFLRYLRVAEGLDRQQVISDYLQGKITAEQVKEMGLKIEQKETFYIEPKLTESETKQEAA